MTSYENSSLIRFAADPDLFGARITAATYLPINRRATNQLLAICHAKPRHAWQKHSKRDRFQKIRQTVLNTCVRVLITANARIAIIRDTVLQGDS